MIDYNEEVHRYILDSAEKLNVLHDGKYSGFRRLDILYMIVNEHIFMCFRDDKPVGFLYATSFNSIFTSDIRILMQQALYAEPGSRGAYLLLKHFLDFGKLTADHVITMVNPFTNIKSSSLEKMGFKTLETLYRWTNGK